MLRATCQSIIDYTCTIIDPVFQCTLPFVMFSMLSAPFIRFSATSYWISGNLIVLVIKICFSSLIL